MKTLIDLEDMKKENVVGFRRGNTSVFEFFFLRLENYYLSKSNGLERIKSELNDWNDEAVDYIIETLVGNINKLNLPGLNPSDLLQLKKLDNEAKEQSLVDDIMIYLSDETKKINGKLYYDETNNFRHLRLTKEGTNNPIAGRSFYLGGLGVLSQGVIDCSTLLDELAALDLNGEEVELKFKHFSYGSTNFLDILKSGRLNIFFRWIMERKEIFIHLVSVNYLFWILIDIVDEALKDYRESYAFHLELKNAFYDVIESDIENFMEKLYTFGYPNVESKDIYSFVGFILTYIEDSQAEELEEDFFTEFLRQIIKAMRKNNAFAISQGDKKYSLFDAYYAVYEKEIKTFDNAILIFDREPAVESKISKEVADRKNIFFKDSKEDRMLQLSDVVVGFASKLSTYLESSSVETLVRDAMELNELQRENLLMWFNLEDRANDLCTFLFHHMQPSSAREKMAILENVVKREG